MLELVPGHGIGPFRLGMGKQQTDSLLEALGLKNDGVTGEGGLGIDFDENDRVTRIGVRAFNGPVRLAISGDPLDNPSDDAVRELLAKHIALPADWTECEQAGLAITHWEATDDFIFSVLVYLEGHRHPKRRPQSGSALPSAAEPPRSPALVATPAKSGVVASEITRQALLGACGVAVAVWERCVADLCLDYEDEVVGLPHHIEPSLPRRSVEAIAASSTDFASLRHEWREPIVALGDGDWTLPAYARLAFHACYNALEGIATADPRLLETAVVQAGQAQKADPNPATSQTRLRVSPQRGSDERVAPPPLISDHMHREKPRSKQLQLVEGRLPLTVDCARLPDLARALYATLGIQIRELEERVEELPRDSCTAEAWHRRWTDGVHGFELARTLSHHFSMETQDRDFRACIELPEHDGRIQMAGDDRIESYTISGHDAPAIRRALYRAAGPLSDVEVAWRSCGTDPPEWVDVARRALPNAAPPDDPLLAEAGWLVAEVDGRNFGIEIVTEREPAFVSWGKAVQAHLIGPLPASLDAVALPTDQLEQLDARQLVSAVTGLDSGPAETGFHIFRIGGWLIRLLTVGTPQELGRLFLQHRAGGALAMFLQTSPHRTAVLVGVRATAQAARDAIIRARRTRR